MLNKWKDKAIKALGGYTEYDMHYMERRCDSYKQLYISTRAYMNRRSKLAAQYIEGPYEQGIENHEEIVKYRLQCKLLDEVRSFIRISTERQGKVVKYTAELEVAIIETPEEKEKEEAQK